MRHKLVRTPAPGRSPRTRPPGPGAEAGRRPGRPDSTYPGSPSHGSARQLRCRGGMPATPPGLRADGPRKWPPRPRAPDSVSHRGTPGCRHPAATTVGAASREHTTAHPRGHRATTGPNASPGLPARPRGAASTTPFGPLRLQTRVWSSRPSAGRTPSRNGSRRCPSPNRPTRPHSQPPESTPAHTSRWPHPPGTGRYDTPTRTPDAVRSRPTPMPVRLAGPDAGRLRGTPAAPPASPGSARRGRTGAGPRTNPPTRSAPEGTAHSRSPRRSTPTAAVPWPPGSRPPPPRTATVTHPHAGRPP